MRNLTIDPMYMWLKCYENHEENKNSYEEYKKPENRLCISRFYLPVLNPFYRNFRQGSGSKYFSARLQCEIMKSATDWQMDNLFTKAKLSDGSYEPVP